MFKVYFTHLDSWAEGAFSSAAAAITFTRALGRAGGIYLQLGPGRQKIVAGWDPVSGVEWF